MMTTSAPYEDRGAVAVDVFMDGKFRETRRFLDYFTADAFVRLVTGRRLGFVG